MTMNPSSFTVRIGALALGGMLAAQTPDRLLHATSPDPATSSQTRVLFDQPGTGTLWALGSTYKASFGSDGFTYVPFFGSKAPQNHPVHFVLRSVRVAGTPLDFSATTTPTRKDSRVSFDRGAVREIYDLAPHGVEQTFVVDGALQGDVDVELEVVTDLVEDSTREGVQFGNPLGQVNYGTAYLVSGTAKTEIGSTMLGGRVLLHVPAAQRGPGLVVIDPLISTSTLTPTTMDSDLPDIAYDATTDRFAVVWVHAFSAVDHDVVAELRTGDGAAIAGSFQPIEISGDRFSSPRVANLNSADRFLVTMELYRPLDPQGKYTIWGRTMDAPAPFGTGGLFQISPVSNQPQQYADVGGDSGTGTQWTVVWNRAGDIVARQVSASGVPSATIIPIEVSGTDACFYPSISLSNGNGLTATPRWCIVYNRQVGSAAYDVFGAVVDSNGIVTKTHAPIVTGKYDLYPQVSSPRVDTGSGPSFMVSYERQGPSPELVVRVLDENLANLVPETNLTRSFGFSNTFSRVESDGIRFAATCKIGANLRVGTLAILNNTLVLHEALQSLASGDYPHIASKRSGGGGPTDYGIAFISNTGTPTRAAIGIYQGRTASGGFNRRSMGCGLGITPSGRPTLGGTITFTLSATGSEQAGMLLGVPAPALALCGTCSLGLLVTGPLILLATPASLPVPSDPIFVGGTVAVQGFAFGSGPCAPNALRLSDTIDVTLQ